MTIAEVTTLGSPKEAFTIKESPELNLGPQEIAIATKAIGIGGVDGLMRRGDLGTTHPQPPFVLGLEAAGIVSAVGRDVTGFEVGQHAVGIMPPAGAYADTIVVPATMAAHLPRNLAFEDACSVVNFVAATALAQQLPKLSRTSNVLIYGAGGGLSQAIAQVLSKKYPGMSITGAARQPSLINIRYFTHVTEVGGIAGRGFDYIFDPIGEARNQIVTSLKPFGVLVALGNLTADDPASIDSQSFWLRNQTLFGFNLGLFATAEPTIVQHALNDVIKKLAVGKLAQDEAEKFRLADVAQSHQAYESHKSSRLVLIP